MELVEWPTRGSMRARVVGVIGARGGVGTSVLAAGLAQRLARETATALVSLDRAAVGLDLLLGLESVPGARWPDLAAARGDVDGADVVALLPRWGSCAVLGPGPTRPGPAPDDGVVDDVLRGVGAVLGAIVLDLDRAAVLAGSVPAVDSVVLVVPQDLAGVAGGIALISSMPGVRVGLVVRGPAPGGLGVAEVVRALEAPVVAAWRSDRRLAASVEHGGLRVAGRTARVVAAAARWLDEAGR
jgi:secretion/DNA translocation related CpaE-like protein